MRLAIEAATEALALGEVPVGALVTLGDRVVARAHNLRELTQDPTAHAERIALTLASRSLNRWRLHDCTLYVTLEPCPMCAGAIVLARIGRVVFAATDPKAGACRSLYRLADDPRFNHRARVEGGLLAEESANLLSTFFGGLRHNRTPRPGGSSSPSEGCLSG